MTTMTAFPTSSTTDLQQPFNNNISNALDNSENDLRKLALKSLAQRIIVPPQEAPIRTTNSITGKKMGTCLIVLL